MGHIPVHGATLTFHVDPDLKARLERAAASQSRPVEEVLRDIAELVKQGVLVRNSGGGRSTSYGLGEQESSGPGHPA